MADVESARNGEAELENGTEVKKPRRKRWVPSLSARYPDYKPLSNVMATLTIISKEDY